MLGAMPMYVHCMQGSNHARDNSSALTTLQCQRHACLLMSILGRSQVMILLLPVVLTQYQMMNRQVVTGRSSIQQRSSCPYGLRSQRPHRVVCAAGRVIQLPIFPLNVVALPEATVPLVVFEARWGARIPSRHFL